MDITPGYREWLKLNLPDMSEAEIMSLLEKCQVSGADGDSARNEMRSRLHQNEEYQKTMAKIFFEHSVPGFCDFVNLLCGHGVP
jgi:hypothetical protein